MDKTRWMVRIAIGMLGSAPACAEVSISPNPEPGASRTASAAVETLLAEPPYAPGWQLRPHFVAFRDHRDERFLTLARVPWLLQEKPRVEDRLPTLAVAGLH